MRPQPLFSGTSMFDVIDARKRTAVSAVDQIPREQFLNSSDEAVIEHVLTKSQFTALELHSDAASMSTTEAHISVRRDYASPFDNSTHMEVPGVVVVVEVPFDGEPELWRYQPSTRSSMTPRGEIRLHPRPVVVITFEARSSDPPKKTKERLDSELNILKQHVNWQAIQVKVANAEFEPLIRDAAVQRRKRLLDQAKLESVLGIPLKRDPTAPRIEAVPIKRRLVRPLPVAPKASYAPEPGIPDADYEHILAVIRHEGRTFEATPTTFVKLEEEELRNVLLAHLNGHYTGAATGETFRGLGKTDVRIESESRAAFVAECKVWSGQKRSAEACDQLLGYLTWRDCKAALVFFNKTVSEFSGLVDKLPAVFEGQPGFRSRVPVTHAGEWRFRMLSSADPSKEVLVHVFLFNLFSKRATGA